MQNVSSDLVRFSKASRKLHEHTLHRPFYMKNGSLKLLRLFFQKPLNLNKTEPLIRQSLHVMKLFSLVMKGINLRNDRCNVS